MMEYFDCHTHEAGKQKEGFLIALDGKGGSDGGYSNDEVIDVALMNHMIPVQYVTYKLESNLETKILKYHPRREKYTIDDIAGSIESYNPKAVIIDTLNQPYCQPNDYWKLIIRFPKIQFLLSHAGGFDILDFLKIAMFQQNAWIDFSHTQHMFGWCGSNAPMPYIVSQIDYALKEERIYRKLLFGSDNMRGEPDCASEALNGYKKYDSYSQIVEKNYFVFLERCGL